MTWKVKITDGCLLEARWRDKVEILCDLPKDSVGLELGVDTGLFSLRMLNMVRPRRLHLVDPWKEYPGMKRIQANHDLVYKSVCEWFKPEIDSGVVAIHRCTSKEACALFADGYFDWILIDADHCYEAASWDIPNYWDKLKVGGWMLIHDYIIHEKKGRLFGAKDATDQFLRAHPEAHVVGYARAMTPFRAYPTIVLEKT